MPRTLPLVGLFTIVLLGGCSSDGAATPTQCEVGRWTSTGMTAPSQAALGDVTPSGGGDGMDITFGADRLFQIDFGPMKPAQATFEKAGEQGILQTTLTGVEKGTWTLDASSKVVGSSDDLSTSTAKVEMILGETVPPVFDETFEFINENRMLGDGKLGVFTVTSCKGDALTMSSPFPGGEIVIDAKRNG